ncbi:MAG TPA: hypothetical protein VK541_16305 [Pedobacter sp.]|uniref:hypothetical protein n=1 Tax=Pedobacter sp. TaxID=1411316 RepID=UPI002C796D73|nr:hypothetical protein [Pedobacter sp.]HMI04051.1 hypothetical protein [Pedobacter sp.]
MSIYLEFPSISDYPVYNPVRELLTYVEELAEGAHEAETNQETKEVSAAFPILV